MKRIFSLKRNEEIGKIIQLRKYIKNDSFVIYFFLKNDSKYARACISVSKKVGNAVVRNKIKRQIRAMIVEIFDFNINNDYVIIVKHNYVNYDFDENKSKLNDLYNKIISNSTRSDKKWKKDF